MRRTIDAAGCVLIAAAMLLPGTPAAHADEASFVRDAKALGFAFHSNNLISMGRSACYFLSRHRSPDQVARRIMRYGNVDLDAANAFLALSVSEYCP